ncbi:hypothetical protein GGF47_002532, partial [Coemansia sp. RSA 2524]
ATCVFAVKDESSLDRIEVERVRRLANALNVSDSGTRDMLKAAGDAKREFPHLLQLVDDVLANTMVKRVVDPMIDRILPTVSNIVNPEHVYRFADNAVNAGFEVTDGVLRAVFGSDSGLSDILYRPRPKKPAMILKYTALSIQLLVRATNVRASSELTLHGLVDPGATPTEASERMCPECIVRQMLPPELGLTVQQEASMTRRLASQVSQLIDEAALELNKPHAQVFESLEAIVRARGGRPRFDPSKLIDPKYTEEGKRLFGRMADLFRKFVAAYVTAVAENGLGSETTAPPTKTESTAVS